MSDVALELSELTVHYGKRVAVDGLSLCLAPGEIVAMLGPNGAGKSTALLATAGALVPTSGRIRVGGADLEEDPLGARAAVGFADQPPSLYEFFTVAEHLGFVGESRGDLDRPGQLELLRGLGLAGIADRLCRELSFGMRQRVGLAAALVGPVRVVLLDETLNGLDPRAAKLAREVLTAAAAEGAAVLMSTHLLGVAERLCHRIVIMDQGKLVADVSGDELRALLDRGPGAVEELYLSRVADVEVAG
jgi:ABC-2 type transport system ATP-binding protein